MQFALPAGLQAAKDFEIIKTTATISGLGHV